MPYCDRVLRVATMSGVPPSVKGLMRKGLLSVAAKLPALKLLLEARDAEYAGGAEKRVIVLDLDNVLAPLEEPRVEIFAIGNIGHRESAGANRPVLLVQIEHRPVSIPLLIGGIIERAGINQRPIHETDASIVRVGVVVEDVADRKLAERRCRPGNIFLPGHLVGTVRDILLLAA